MCENSSCFLGLIKDKTECKCSCHTTGAIHIHQCCDQCCECGKRIEFGRMEEHKKYCPGPKIEIENEPEPSPSFRKLL